MCLWFADAIQLFTCLQKMKKFAAVKFIDSEEVEAVPLLWLKSNASGTLCSWPPYRSPTRLSQAISGKSMMLILYDVAVRLCCSYINISFNSGCL